MAGGTETDLRPAGAGPRSDHDCVRTVSVAYTPDSDDAFNYYAWEHGRVELKHCRAEFHRDHIVALNRAASEERYDVVAISSAYYPRVASRYRVLGVGNSVGRGYGPVLASRFYSRVDELCGKRIAVAGIATTGGALAAMYCSGAELVELRYDRIADAVASGQADAGVMIHEELLFFSEKGLHKVCDLGAVWCEDTKLPLPVGLNVVNRRLGLPLAEQIARTCRRSLEWGFNHSGEALEFASRFGRGCTRKHVELFCNEDTRSLPEDVRRALGIICARVARMGLGPKIEPIEIIDG